MKFKNFISSVVATSDVGSVQLKDKMEKFEDMFNKKKLDELVEFISLTHKHIIEGVPIEVAGKYEKMLQSREELSDYGFEYNSSSGDLVISKKYGEIQNA